MKKIFMVLLLLIIAVFASIYYYMDRIIAHGIEKHGSAALGVPVKVSWVKFGLADGEFYIKGFRAENPEGFKSDVLFKADNIKVRMDIKSIFDKVLRIYSVEVNDPYVIYELNENGDNIKALRSRISSSSYHEKIDKKEEKRIILEKFYINKGKVAADLLHNEKSLDLPDIYISDMGKNSNGITVANAADQIIRELSKAIARVNLKALLDDRITDFKNKLKGGADSVEGHAIDKAIDILLPTNQEEAPAK